MPCCGPCVVEKERLTLVEISLDVIDEFNADGEADKVLGHAAGRLLLVRQLLVRRRGRVNDERLRVADVGQVGGQLEAVNKG